MLVMQALWFAVLAMPLSLVVTSPAWLAGKIAARTVLRGGPKLNFLIKTSMRRWAGWMAASVAALVLLMTYWLALNLALLLCTYALIAVACYFAFMIAAASKMDDPIESTPALDKPMPGAKLDAMDLALMEITESDTK